MNLINDNIFEEIDEKSIWDDLKNKENNLSYSDFKDVFKQTTVFIYLTKMFGKSIMISPKVKYLI
ncbi:MAG: hypothetical protein CMF62_03305 [Magnetococcales bacterium]|nr:hypothetical protein [Magnetococcales bacterium]